MGVPFNTERLCRKCNFTRNCCLESLEKGPDGEILIGFTLTLEQEFELLKVFNYMKYLNPAEEMELRRKLQLKPEQIQLWFKRQRYYYQKAMKEFHQEFLALRRQH